MNIISFVYSNLKVYNPILQQIKFISRKNYDERLVKNLIEKIENEKSFKEINVDDFIHLSQNNDDKKKKISKIIQIYENMKYNLEDIPTTLRTDDILHLLQLFSHSDIKRYIKKLYRKELGQLLKQELKNFNKKTSKAITDSSNRTGLFDKNRNLIYGLWHNTLFTRVVSNKLNRFTLDKYRIAGTFGQNLYLDFSYSHHLSYHLSSHVAADTLFLINFNFKKVTDPFNITLCGVDYNHYLWKLLIQNFPSIIDSVEHTTKSYLEFVPDKSKIVYFTSLETNNILEYNPNYHYVMPALSEKNIHQNFLLPSLEKLNIKRYGVPIDQYVLWNTGSKRLSLKTKLQILNDLRDKKNWKEIITTNIDQRRFKTENLKQVEDKQRFLRIQKDQS